MTVVLLIVIAVLAYVVGMWRTQVFVSGVLYHKDIRFCGSCQPTYTNLYRVYGAKAYYTALALDVIKSVAMVLLAKALMLPLGSEFCMVGSFFCCLVLVIGAMFPATKGFRGAGRGLLICFAAMATANIKVGLCMLIIFGAVLVGSKIVSLSAMAAIVSACLAAWIIVPSDNLKGLCGLLALFTAILVLWRNRGTILKIAGGKEKKIRFSKKAESVLQADQNF